MIKTTTISEAFQRIRERALRTYDEDGRAMLEHLYDIEGSQGPDLGPNVQHWRMTISLPGARFKGFRPTSKYRWGFNKILHGWKLNYIHWLFYNLCCAFKPSRAEVQYSMIQAKCHHQVMSGVNNTGQSSSFQPTKGSSLPTSSPFPSSLILTTALSPPLICPLIILSDNPLPICFAISLFNGLAPNLGSYPCSASQSLTWSSTCKVILLSSSRFWSSRSLMSTMSRRADVLRRLKIINSSIRLRNSGASGSC